MNDWHDEYQDWTKAVRHMDPDEQGLTRVAYHAGWMARRKSAVSEITSMAVNLALVALVAFVSYLIIKK